MIKINLIIVVAFPFLFYSCKEENAIVKKHFYDLHKNVIGDSIFIKDILQKIVFTDTLYEIDSVVYYRYDNLNNSIKSTRTFRKGKNVFENVEYHENGKIKKYSFIDEDNSNYYYELIYIENGVFIKNTGYLFFQGFIVDSASKNITMKKGSTINYRIYYPNPPDCVSRIYIRNDDGSVYDVFQKSKFLNFLETTYQDISDTGVYKVNIVLELRDKSIDTVIEYRRDLIYSVHH